MATMVMTPPQLSLPTSNGHVLNGSEDMQDAEGLLGANGNNGGHQESYDVEACNQAKRRSKKALLGKQELRRSSRESFSSFKNVLFGANAPETQNGNHESYGAEMANGNNGAQHQEDQNGAPDQTFESAYNGQSEQDSEEKFDLHKVPEPHELGNAFPPCFGQSSSVNAAEEQIIPSASHPTNVTTNNAVQSASRPSSPYEQGQDVQINGVQKYSPRGTQFAQGDAVITTNIRSASFQSAKGEYLQHQEQHTVLNSTAHPQSQILLTISAPSPVPSQSGHHELGETALSYQPLPHHMNEAPQQWLKEGCQLPECVKSRAAGISAAGGAQLEHLLARVKHEKTVSRARAWEEGAKAKAFNRYTRDESKITAWENTMKAKAEARMRKAQESLDKQRAKHIEKMKNAVASAHCKAQEMRAAMEARKSEDIVKAEEIASRIRATGKMPRKCLCLTA